MLLDLNAINDRLKCGGKNHCNMTTTNMQFQKTTHLLHLRVLCFHALASCACLDAWKCTNATQARTSFYSQILLKRVQLFFTRTFRLSLMAFKSSNISFGLFFCWFFVCYSCDFFYFAFNCDCAKEIWLLCKSVTVRVRIILTVHIFLASTWVFLFNNF